MTWNEYLKIFHYNEEDSEKFNLSKPMADNTINKPEHFAEVLDSCARFLGNVVKRILCLY